MPNGKRVRKRTRAHRARVFLSPVVMTDSGSQIFSIVEFVARSNDFHRHFDDSSTENGHLIQLHAFFLSPEI